MRFSNFPYLPAFENSRSSHIAYERLTDEQKQLVLPLFEIGQRGKGESLEDAIEQVRDVVPSLPYLLDVSNFSAPQVYIKSNPTDEEIVQLNQLQAQQDQFNHDKSDLLVPDNGFENWRATLDSFPNAIPCLAHTDLEANSNSIIRQAAMFGADGFSRVALRVDLTGPVPMNGLRVVGNLIAMMGSPANLLIILDCGTGRIKISERLGKAVECIRAIERSVELDERPQLNFIVFAESFGNPQKKGLFVQDDKFYGCLDDVRSSGFVGQGDYASLTPRQSSTTFVPGDWVARCVFPVEGEWLVYRSPNTKDSSGWVTGAQLIVEHDNYVQLADCWGNNIFINASNGDISEADRSGIWYAARANKHVVNQLEVIGLL